MITKYAKTKVAKAANALGYKIERLSPAAAPPHYLQLDSRYSEIINAVQPYTMTGCERIAALVDAARYVVHAKIPGALVECGVWRGGSMMAAALTLLKENDIRDLYLFDTYSGMSIPTEADIDHAGSPAMGRYLKAVVGDRNQWCYASLEDVQANVAATGYPQHRCHFVKGDVLKTIPSAEPTEIAILRLDTDWYESTLHELTHLYPKLAPHGIVIIDDYGHWKGCRKAVDEFFSGRKPFLCRIDYTGVIGVKADTNENWGQ